MRALVAFRQPGPRRGRCSAGARVVPGAGAGCVGAWVPWRGRCSAGARPVPGAGARVPGARVPVLQVGAGLKSMRAYRCESGVKNRRAPRGEDVKLL